jgi:hypothetical protein
MCFEWREIDENFQKVTQTNWRTEKHDYVISVSKLSITGRKLWYAISKGAKNAIASNGVRWKSTSIE